MGKSVVEKAKEEVKQKQKQAKETEMKTIKPNQTVKTILTVFVTLLTVAAFAATFMAGMNYQQGIDAKVNSAVESALASKTETVE